MSGAPLLKFKARLTARGDLVDPSRINPDQLNAPTIDPEMVRVIIALVAADPACRFIQSAHAPPIFLRAPQGMDSVPARHLLQLNISSTLTQQGWTKHPTENCLWHAREPLLLLTAR